MSAVNHPTYTPSDGCTYEEAAAPVIDAILSGGSNLPDDLYELRQHIEQDVSHAATLPPPKKATRDNIWNEEHLDVSRLKIKDEDDP